jgi:hypothetical protein
VESGEFWSTSGPDRIDRRNRIDAALLRDISATEKQLIRANLTIQAAHGLITRTIFLAYLQDRKILTPDFLKEAFGSEALSDILSSEKGAADLFEWLRSTFNGDLFGGPSESLLDGNSNSSPASEHLKIVQEFLSGAEMTSGQRRFWAYDFSVIPVELISSIYERFAYADDSLVARRQSTHYTPINLVDIVLSQVFSRSRPNARILDMACGSGVFLVESLRRIVAQRVTAGEPWNRQTIRQALYGQIFGIDINPEAIRIAMFSLYLTALELDPEPQPPSALRFEPLIGSNLIIGDAFPNQSNGSMPQRQFPGKDFDIIVGNPPWSRNEGNRGPARYCQGRGLPLTRLDTPDQAFLWRSLDFCNSQTTVGLILHGKPLFSHTPSAASVRLHLVDSFKPRLMMNLSGLRLESLFPTSAAPAMILVADVGASLPKETTVLVAAQRDRTFRHHGIVELEADDVKEIDARLIGTDPDFLKITSWGSARDLQLIRRLRGYSTLGDVLDKGRQRGWAAGQGLQLAGGTQQSVGLRGMPFLQSGQLPVFELNPEHLETFGAQLLHRPRDKRIYRAPLIITPRGMKGPSFRAAFCASDVVYSEVYYGIAIPRSEKHSAHYLNAVLNSELATYFLFITGSSWGVERDEVKPEDLRRLPLPPIESVDKRSLKNLLSIEKDLRSNPNPKLLTALNDAISDIYDIDESERIVISDFVHKTIPAWFQGWDRSSHVDPSQLKAYAAILVRVIDSLLSARGERRAVAEIINAPQSGLRVVRLRTIPRNHRGAKNEMMTVANINSALVEIEAALNERHPGLIVRRVLRIYGAEDVYIVKPADQRYWTRSRALNDADAMIAEQLGKAEWRS